MSDIVNLRSLPNNSAPKILENQKDALEKEVFSLVKNIETNEFLINDLRANIVNLKKSKVVVSLNEYRKILNELSYLNNNLIVLKDICSKNESHLKDLKKITQKKEGKLIKLPIKKIKRRRSTKKDST